MYAVVLVLHSWVRWIVVLAGVAFLVRTFGGLRQKRPWTPLDELSHKAFLRSFDVQFLLGTLLYAFLSPISRAFLAAGGAGMKDPTLRFFGLEHAFGMVVAIALVHIGRGRSRKAPSDAVRHRRAFTFSLLGFLVAFVSVPWPFMKTKRPLARFGSESAAVATAGEPTGSCPPVYKTRCVACHGEEGRGDGMAAQSLKPLPRDFGDPAWQAQKSDEHLRAVIQKGGAATGLSVAMPANADLSPQEIDALVKCVRAFQR